MARKPTAKKAPRKKRPVPRAGLDRPYCNGQWTRARFFGFIRSSLRRASSRWGPIFQCLKDAETGKKINKSSGRLAMHYRCSGCREEFSRKQIEVDHIIEAGSLSSFEDLPGFVSRLFVEKEGLRTLCSKCHKERH